MFTYLKVKSANCVGLHPVILVLTIWSCLHHLYVCDACSLSNSKGSRAIKLTICVYEGPKVKGQGYRLVNVKTCQNKVDHKLSNFVTTLNASVFQVDKNFPTPTQFRKINFYKKELATANTLRVSISGRPCKIFPHLCS